LFTLGRFSVTVATPRASRDQSTGASLIAGLQSFLL
jgi:hypothetical protein